MYEDRQRYYEDCEVRSDVSRCVDVPLGIVRYASGIYRLFPEPSDWVADEDANDHLRQRPGADDDHGNNDGRSHLSNGEHPIVLRQEGQLDE